MASRGRCGWRQAARKASPHRGVLDNEIVKIAAVIPAKNEAPTVGQVVDAARQAQLVDEVIVVDNGSSDRTAQAAADRGAFLVTSREPGKGETMRAGVDSTDAEVIVFLDADLTGLRADHVDRLVRPVVEGRAGMVCGLFDRGPLLNPLFLRLLPILTGERALRREIFESLGPDDLAGYKVEAALNSFCSEHDIPTIAFVCDGMFHRTKEEKYESVTLGVVQKVLMLLSAIGEYGSYALRHRLGRRLREGIRAGDRAA